MKKLYIEGTNWEKVYVDMKIEVYATHPQIAILLYVHDTWEYYWDLSVFVEPFDYPMFMAVDIHNMPDAQWFIIRYKLWSFITFVRSWFNEYPVFAMNLWELLKYDSDWVDKVLS
jgi:hypothetical protein